MLQGVCNILSLQGGDWRCDASEEQHTAPIQSSHDVLGCIRVRGCTTVSVAASIACCCFGSHDRQLFRTTSRATRSLKQLFETKCGPSGTTRWLTVSCERKIAKFQEF
jgi:hypothetical protein